MLSLPKAQVQFLVRELRSHKPGSVAKKKKKNLFNFFNLKNKNSHGFRVRSKRQISEHEGKKEEGEQRRNSEKLRFQRSRVQM